MYVGRGASSNDVLCQSVYAGQPLWLCLTAAASDLTFAALGTLELTFCQTTSPVGEQRRPAGNLTDQDCGSQWAGGANHSGV